MRKLKIHARILVLALASASPGGCTGTDRKPPQPVPVSPAVVRVAPATVGPIAGVLAISGVVVPGPGAEWTVVAPETARLVEVSKAVGDSVRVGDVLVTYEFTTESKPASQRRSTVVATFPGIVTHVWHAAGDVVEASSKDSVLRVVDLARLQVLVAVPVGELKELVVGRPARIGGEGGVAGRVVSLPSALEATSATGDVRLAATTRLPMLPGATVDVAITAQTRPNAVLVPTAAIGRKDGAAFVMVVGGDRRARRVPVVVGVSSADQTEISAGVSAGDEVIVSGLEPLEDGRELVVSR